MAADASWLDASPDEVEDSKCTMEKQFLCLVYNDVFFPHESAMKSNQVYWSHVNDDLQYITADHEAVQIRPECRGEMPWPAAQHALLRMNAYKTPADKLICVVSCCTMLMEALQLSGRSAGADDFFPLLGKCAL